ncbi:MAG: fasciclin domain-containing protein [Cyclobacteriaceae bacterium]|nr:fasciclin domain-containing protein [Cyclobacteriaceae bacterium]UYN87341.1 MAG: fasciclin domain-containing protein [Cyclobacteriaceae bacterium]
MKRYLNLYSFVAVLAFSGILAACSEFEQPEPASGPTIVQVASTNPDLNILFAALNKTGLARSYNNVNSGNFTVFAPHDSAFTVFFRGALNQPAWDEIDVINYINNTMSTTSTVNIATLTSRLNYHIFSSEVVASQISGRQVFTTQQGGRLSISKVGSQVLLNANNAGTGAGNGAKVITTNIDASNGVIHTVNKVLNPVTTASALASLGISINYGTNPPTITPSLAAAEAAADGNAADFDILVYAIVKGEMATTLLPNSSPLPDFTIFTANDGRWLAALSAATEADAIAALKAMSVTEVANMVKNQIVAGRVLSTDLTNGQTVNTLLAGKSFTINISGATVTLNDGANNPDVTTANILTNAGVLHRIDDVLK